MFLRMQHLPEHFPFYLRVGYFKTVICQLSHMFAVHLEFPFR